MFKYKYEFIYWTYDRLKPFTENGTIVADSMEIAALEIDLMIFESFVDNKNWCRSIYPEITLIKRIRNNEKTKV